MDKLTIRKSEYKDIDKILEIFDSARKYMKAHNNHSQWSGNYPGKEDVINDIDNGFSYVGLNQDGDYVMTFAFIIGEDPTYKVIKGGNWLNNEPYGTIHRIASNGKISGILKSACEFCFNHIGNIRIDTHNDNSPMLTALNNLGFIECGIINCRDGSPRIAFQKIKEHDR